MKMLNNHLGLIINNYQSQFMNCSKYIIAFSGLIIIAGTTMAQDTSRKKTIDITSTFKPALRDAAKINFNAVPPATDSMRPRLTYNIPQQPVSLNYQSGALSPVALPVQSLAWQNSNYIKLGVGNVHLPYVQAGFTFGDIKSASLNIFAKGYSSKGSLDNQKNTYANVGAKGFLKSGNNMLWDGNVGFTGQDYYFYGYHPDTLKFTKKDVRQRFRTFEGGIGLQNINSTEFGINYHPSFKISGFNGKNIWANANELNAVLDVPVEKTINEQFTIKLGATANITSYRKEGINTINNNIYYVSPAVVYRGENLWIHGGVIPSWDNKNFHLLPDMMAELTTNDKKFTLQAGWLGSYDKGSYQRFATVNPWIMQPDSLLNTRKQEFYGGIKGILGKGFTYNAKAGVIQYRNVAMFVNDTSDGKTFETVYASSMKAFHVHGEIGYAKGEIFNASASLDMYQYGTIKNQPAAWGLLPVEFNADMRWQVIKDLYWTANLSAWGPPDYRTKDLDVKSGKGAFDLSTGLEFKITRQLNLWLQMNNILNNKYERWNQYQVYGFNVLGGIVFNFNVK